jgi:UDP-N-acetylmuramate--alanine ligase
MSIKDVKKVHMVGIGGIGISALAQLLHHDGYDISGTNDSESPETLDRIRDLGVPIHIGADIENIDPDTDLVVYSAAWTSRAPEFMEAIAARGIPMKSYFEMLGDVSRGKKTVAVAGTHGKTTTTAMLARTLRDAGASPTAIVGSVVREFDSNYLSGDSELFVAESCEYRRHFLNLTPTVLVVTNIEFDHSDYFKDLADVQSAFRTFMEKVPAGGSIITNPHDPNIAPLLEGLAAEVIDYTQEPALELSVPGEFNQMNARAAAAAARAAFPSITDDTVRASLAAFEGTWRRFEHKGKTARGADVYDDYAHHPTAVRKTITAAKEKGTGKLFIAFHPHTYSRTRDLFDEFTTAFAGADKVYIAPIFAAREPDDGVTSSEKLAEHIRMTGVDAVSATFDEIREALETEPREGDIVMTMGAGDIYKVADQIVKK